MKIGYVLHPYEESHASGMGYSMLELCKQLVTRWGDENEIVVYTTKRVSPEILPGAYTNVLIPSGLVRQLLYFLFVKRVDTLFFTAPLLPLIPFSSIKSAMLCKELGSQKMPVRGKEAIFAYFRDRLLMTASLKRANMVFVSSQATKDDLLKFYKTPQEKIFVTYEGFQDLTKIPQKDYQDNVAVDMRPYFFFTGKLKYRKNVHGIVSAFIAFKKRNSSKCKLIIGGSAEGSYYEKIKREIDSVGFTDDVYFAGYVSPEDLYQFYKNAVATVFPSFNEGFGMPILESMNIGTPVITSNISSMREIAKDAAVLVDPYSVEEISQAMERLYSKEEERKKYIEKGHIIAQKFSWPKVADSIMAVIQNSVQ